MNSNGLTYGDNPVGHRSQVSKDVSLVRFYNACSVGASVVWLDYNGERVLYTRLTPGQFIDMNTFVTHPWTFETSSAGDRLNGDSCQTFLPQVKEKRHIVNITYPMYSLKERSLQVVRDCLDPDRGDDLTELGLPKPLDGELQLLITKKTCAQVHCEEPPVPNLVEGNGPPHTCFFRSFLLTRFAPFRRI